MVTNDVQSREPRLIRWVLCISVLVIPMVISPSGRDTFRLPKDLVFRAEAIVLIVLVMIGLILRQVDVHVGRWRRSALLLPAAAMAWTSVTTLASTNRLLSLPVLGSVAGACVVFSLTLIVARREGLTMLHWLLGAGIINAVLYLLQASVLWNPFNFTSAYRGHNAATGLLGNSNDVGSFLLPVTIAATAAALATRERRVFTTVTAVVTGGAVLVSVSVASIGGLIAALASLALIWNWRRSLALLVVVLISLGFLSRMHEPFRFRINETLSAARAGEWDAILSGRLTAYASAASMFRDHPLTGVGPGVFGWQYFPYKLELSKDRPDLFMATPASRYSFEEVHNDHLEVLAETGAPGYLLFLGSLSVLAMASFRKDTSDQRRDDPRMKFAKYAGLPLAIGVAVTSLAQYPLQLTSSLVAILFVAGLTLSWSDAPEKEESDGA